MTFSLQSKFRKIISYVLSEQVWWCNIKWFLSYSKNYICKFMLANSWHHKLFHFHLSFLIWKVWKGRVKSTKDWISWEQKGLFRWNKKHFSYFLKGCCLVKKIKIWWKLVDTSFNFQVEFRVSFINYFKTKGMLRCSVHV